MESNIGEVVKEIESKDLINIAAAYHENRKTGDNVLTHYLAAKLDIDEPDIEYLPIEGGMATGAYDRKNNTIELYYGSSQNLTKTGNFQHAKTLAHEMWHAFQYEKACIAYSNHSNYRVFTHREMEPETLARCYAFKGETNQSFLYAKNYLNYIEYSISQSGYANQLLEHEARAFSCWIDKAMRAVVEKKEEPSDNLVSEAIEEESLEAILATQQKTSLASRALHKIIGRSKNGR